MTDQDFNRELHDIAENVDRVAQKMATSHKAATTFVAVDKIIMLGRFCVGRMKSKTYAIRTANALNAYKPNDRGV